MTFSALQRKSPAVLLTTVVLALASTSGCLNPTFVNQIAGGTVVPLAPGDTPFVHLLFINATAAKIIDINPGFAPRFQGLSAAWFRGIDPQRQMGLLLPCPVTRVGMGNPEDLSQAAMVIDGTLDVPAAAFPLFLQEGRDFYCGDAVVFTITDDPTNGYGIRVSAGRVDGTTQEGPFSGPDTFQILNTLLIANGGVPPVVVP